MIAQSDDESQYVHAGAAVESTRDLCQAPRTRAGPMLPSMRATAGSAT